MCFLVILLHVIINRGLVRSKSTGLSGYRQVNSVLPGYVYNGYELKPDT